MLNMLQGNICYAVCVCNDKRMSANKEMETIPLPHTCQSWSSECKVSGGAGAPEKADQEWGQLFYFEFVAGRARGSTLPHRVVLLFQVYLWSS